MNIAQMMKQAQEMKTKMAEMQAKVLDLEIPGESGAGMVKVVMNGKHEMKKLDIDPSIIKADEKEIMEDLIMAAVNDARNRVEERVSEETRKIMQDMGLPPGMDLPF